MEDQTWWVRKAVEGKPVECHVIEAKVRDGPRIMEWFTILTSAQKTHRVSTESVSRFSDVEVPGDPSQTYYGGGQTSELRSVGRR